jgi:hypothetical protein
MHWSVPSKLSSALHTGAELTLAGRNLATWSKYPGLDPEISLAPPSSLPREDAFLPPIPREFIVRLDVRAR